MRQKLFLLALLLLPAALLIHLGAVVFIDDEAIRSLVAQEMLWSGNFIFPTLHGDAYLNKPPLWNWILALSFYLHGGASEWAARLPTTLALVAFAATAYHFSRQHFSQYLAAVHALTVITCGRMLFWDSMLALIDVTFSLVVYAQVMLLYTYGRRGQWAKAFAWSYALTAVGFMLKGLPAFVFQGITLLALLAWTRAWKQLLRPAHLLSGLGCLAVLGIYYWQYSYYVDLPAVFTRLFLESGKRTAVAHGFGDLVQHLLAFPFEMSYHFLPWTFLLVYLFQRGSWRRLKENDFAAFCLVAFLVNLPVYWLSPNVYPRYLLMLFPLLFGSLLHLHAGHEARRTRTYVGLRYLLLGLMTVTAVVLPFVPLLEVTAGVPMAWVKSLTVGAAAGAVCVAAWRKEGQLLLLFAIFLLLLRIGFNFFVLPTRAAESERALAVRETATAAMRAHPQDSVAIFAYTLIEPATGYYLSMARGRVIPRQWQDFAPQTLYIISPLQYPGVEVLPQDSIYLRHLRTYYPLGTLPNPPAGPIPLEEPLRDGMGTGLWESVVH